ncbi:TPA: hypothetical protein ACH3X2_002818 [Trebouxia sp. C0005]
MTQPRRTEGAGRIAHSGRALNTCASRDRTESESDDKRQSQSDTSNTSMDSTDTATMHNREGVHPAGTHSNPIPSSVLSKPIWSTFPQSAPQEGSISRPLSSSILTAPNHPHPHISYADRTASGHFYETPHGNKMTFVPTAQTPNPSQAHPKAGLPAPQGASLPPTIQQAAAATAAAATAAAATQA